MTSSESSCEFRNYIPLLSEDGSVHDIVKNLGVIKECGSRETLIGIAVPGARPQVDHVVYNETASPE